MRAPAWIASSPRPLSRQNPARFVSLKASVPAAHATRFGWVPRQAINARIVLLDAETAITVPNIALAGSGDRVQVSVVDGGTVSDREVRLGVRGPSRSQVVEGLAPGDRVVLATATVAPGTESAPDDAAPPEATP